MRAVKTKPSGDSAFQVDIIQSEGPAPSSSRDLPDEALLGGSQGFIGVNWIEKGQAHPEAGWEIEGDTYGTEAQIQALYAQDGREIQLILQLVGDAMAVSVADVAAQKPK